MPESREPRHICEKPMCLHEIDVPGQGTLYLCRHCRVTFKLESRLLAHAVFRHGGRYIGCARTLACRMCPQRFKRQRTMALHIGTHLGERQCSKCGAEFASAAAATAHKTFHRTGGNFQCGFCGVLFIQKSDRDEHLGLEHSRQRRMKRPRFPTTV
ncbi:uncharacterized protein LOC144095083 isoform X2 [Amblyomma americanum]